MINLKVILSNTTPKGHCLWVKPVNGGFALYAVSNGGCKALKVVDGGDTLELSDDKVIKMSTENFVLKVTSTKDGVADVDINAVKDAIAQKLGPDILNLWSQGPIEFNFTAPDSAGKNLIIKATDLEMKLAVGIDDSGDDPVVAVSGTPSYVHSNTAYKNNFLTTFFKNTLESLDPDDLEDILDEGATT